MRRLVLVGLPATGKTTLARVLAERWQVPALDTDDEIATTLGTPVPEFLRSEGEANFRARELDALVAVLNDGEDFVLATGGGIVTTADARALLKQECTIWLDCADEVLLSRLGDVERPLLSVGAPDALARLRKERDEWYREVSRARIDTAPPIDEVVAQTMREVDRLTR